MIKCTCRICMKFIPDPNWCKHCEKHQYQGHRYSPMPKDKKKEIDSFAKDLIAKANGYGKVKTK